jgi:hypothetical protein
MTEHTRERPNDAPAVPGAVASAALSGVADHLAALRVAAGETDALAAVTAVLFDDGDWTDPKPVLVDRLASLSSTIPVNDLTAKEQKAVRTALRFLRLRVGAWAPLVKALRYQWDSLQKVVVSRPCRRGSPAWSWSPMHRPRGASAGPR